MGSRVYPRSSGFPSLPANDYGYWHRQRRRSWAAKVEKGEVVCARCGRLIQVGQPWDLGHDDFDRTRYAGPEHRRCNRATKGRANDKRRKFRSQIW